MFFIRECNKKVYINNIYYILLLYVFTIANYVHF